MLITNECVDVSKLPWCSTAVALSQPAHMYEVKVMLYMETVERQSSTIQIPGLVSGPQALAITPQALVITP